MKLENIKKYTGNKNELPIRNDFQNNCVYREIKNVVNPSVKINIVSFMLCVLFLFIVFLRVGLNELLDNYKLLCLGCFAVFLSLIPHELLHAVFFKDKVYLFHNLKKFKMFVIGTEDMSKAKYITMCLCPNIILGFIPFIIFLIEPSLIFLGSFGALAISVGTADYINVVKTLRQVDNGATIYLSGSHSYWYKP